jgi:hypothetical protein
MEWLRSPFDLADILIRARGVRRIEPQPHCGSPFWRVSRALVLELKGYLAILLSARSRPRAPSGASRHLPHGFADGRSYLFPQRSEKGGSTVKRGWGRRCVGKWSGPLPLTDL